MKRFDVIVLDAALRQSLVTIRSLGRRGKSIAAVETSIGVLAPGGCCVLIGIPPRGAHASFDIASMFAGRRIMGSYNGAVRAHHDIPLIFELARQGALDLDSVVTRTYPLDEVHDALGHLRSEAPVRAVLVY